MNNLGQAKDRQAEDGGADESTNVPLSPEESLRLIERQRALAARKIGGSPLLYYLPWGVVWLVGYGIFFLRYGPAGEPLLDMPALVPAVVLGVLTVLAIAITTYAGIRAGRGVAGVSGERGAYYGMAWFAAFAMMGAIGGRLSEHLPEPEAALYWTATSTSIMAVLYMAGAAVWRDRSMLVIGGWVGLANLLGVAAGPGWHALAVSVGGGGALIVAGVLLELAARRRTR